MMKELNIDQLFFIMIMIKKKSHKRYLFILLIEKVISEFNE